MEKLTPFILCGGKGERLYPLSRAQCPKPFLTFGTAHTLLEQTIARLDDELFHPPYFIADTTAAKRIDSPRVLVESVSRNTAAAVARSCLHHKAGEVMIVPSDHIIEDKSAFIAMVKRGRHVLAHHNLVIFGVRPRLPSTLYGYVKKGQAVGDNTFTADEFTEKPHSTTAADYCASGSYLWNMGMFLFEASTMVRLFERLQPDILSCVSRGDLLSCPSVSFDHALVEQLERVAVVESDLRWRDLGSWQEVAAFVRTRLSPDKEQSWGEYYSFDSIAHLFFIHPHKKTTAGAPPLRPLRPLKDRQLFCLVLEGEARLGAHVVLGQGESKVLPSGAVHQIENQQPTPLTVVMVELV